MTKLLLTLALLVAIFQQADAQTRVAYVLMQFPDSIPTDWVSAQQTSAAEADQFFAGASRGQLMLQGDVYGTYTVDLNYDSGTLTAIRDAAKAALIADGVDITPYEPGNYVFLTPCTVQAYQGYGQNFQMGVFLSQVCDRTYPAGGSFLWHELGHHFGLAHHEHAMPCLENGGQVPFSGACSSWEYGDTLGVMGQGRNYPNAALQEMLGWLTPQVITQSGDYLLPPFEDGYAIRFATGGRFPLTFYLEYRQPIGFDYPANRWTDPANIYNGVTIHYWKTLEQESYLLAMNPNTVPPSQSGNFDRPAMLAGQSYCFGSGGGRVNLSVLSVGPAGAVVRFNFKRC